MMAVLWRDIMADMTSAKRHLSAALEIYGDLSSQAGGDYRTEMAFQHAMQSGYTSFESGLGRLLAMLDEPLPVGPDSHAMLLRRLAQEVPGQRPALLDQSLLSDAQELRRFRHVAMHTYDDFDPRRAAPPIEAARHLVEEVDTTVERFRRTLDPD